MDSRFSGMIVVDPELRVRRLSDLVRVRPTASLAGQVHSDADQGIPLSPDGRVVSGGVYPASDGSAVSYGMATYSLTRADGRYSSSLRWRGPDDDPNGPIAFLSISVTPSLPKAEPGRTLLPLAHDVVARLVYRVPIQTSDPQARAESAEFTMDLGTLLVDDDGTRRLRYPISDKAEFDRIWSAMTTPASETRLELRCLATVGYRTWQMLIPERFTTVDQRRLLKRGVLLSHVVEIAPGAAGPTMPAGVRRLPATAVEIQPDIAGSVVRSVRLPDRPITVLAATDGNAPGWRVLEEATLSRAVRRPGGTGPTPDGPEIPSATGRRPYPPVDPDIVLHHAQSPDLSTALEASDLSVAGRHAVPIRILTGPDRRPVIVSTTATCVQALDFVFDVGVNANMFDVPGDLRPSANRILIRSEFDPGGDRPLLTYYEDSALPGSYYYQPAEFRIPREDGPPFLPQLRLAFYDVVEAPDETAAGHEITVRYRVRLVYRAVPHVDRFVLAELRRHLSAHTGDPQLSVLLPESVSLRLLLPSDAAGGSVVAQMRPQADTTFDNGIVDEVDLSPSELAAVMALLRGLGVDGSVTAALIGSSSAEVPVHLSLKETTATPLGRAFRGPVSPGVVRVTVTNRLESPLVIEELYRSPAGEGAVAYPVADPGMTIAPGGQADLDYRVHPPDADVPDVEPMLQVTVLADLAGLLPRLMTNQGYASDTFGLTLSLDPAYLGQIPPAATEPLTGVRVEFDRDTSATLDASHLSVDVRVRIPILGWLLGDPDAARYRYRVSNLFGSGEATHPGPPGDWISGSGEGTVVIVPVGA